MSGQQKRGFRLPWTAEQRGSDEVSGAAVLDQGTLDSAPAALGADLDDPVADAGRAPAMTTDAAPAASDVPDASAEAEMIDTDTPQDRIERAAGAAWPSTDSAADAAQAEAAPDGDPQEDAEAPAGDAAAPAAARNDAPPAPTMSDRAPAKGRRENPIVAGLVKAMREAAVASRAETTTRIQGEAAAKVEAIRAESTEEAAALRKRVDEDIAGIREWSKVEMARIRAETEHRIEERRADAIKENQRHLDAVEQLIEQVQSTVSRYESDMDRFFERLLAETDPAALASLAEQAPEPPDLSGDLTKPAGWTTDPMDLIGMSTSPDEDDTSDSMAEDAVEAETTPVEAQAEALEATEAAEAEAAATEGLDLSGATEWPAAVMAAAARRTDERSTTDEAGDSSRLLVSGLSSVAGISAFKGAIAGLSGVRSVSVSTGERGVFIYTVNHEPETDIAAAVSSLSAFAAQVTESTADGLAVTAHEPAA